MTGFELKLNGKKISAGVGSGAVHIIATILNNKNLNSFNVDITGLDSSEEEDKLIVWFNSKLNLGDEFTVAAKEIKESSKPIKIRKRDTEKIDEMNLKSYYSLKKKLEERGLI